MRQQRREQIGALADAVRNTCQLTVPIDVNGAVARLNGVLREVDEAEFEAKVEKTSTGFEITLAQQNELRKRFSLAHELGHLFLHMGYLVDDEKWKSVGTYTDSVYYRFGYTTEEYEANEFAAALLMPRDEFTQVCQKFQENDRFHVTKIADHFKVSTEAAANRGRWLGLFSWER